MPSQQEYRSILSDSADCVIALGTEQIQGLDVSLEEALTIENVPLWSLIVCDLAIYRIAPLLAENFPRRGFLACFKESILRRRYELRDYYWKLRYSNRENFSVPPNICVLGFSPYMFRDVLSPVTKAFKAQQSNASMLVLFDHLKLPLTPENYTTQSIWSLHSADVEKRVKQGVQLLEGRLNAVLNSIERSLNNHQVSREQKAAISHVLRIYLNSLAPHLLRLGCIAESFLDKHKPEILLSADIADMRCRAWIHAARRQKIPVVNVQFGNAGTEAIEWRFHIFDTVALWGEHAKDVMRSMGVSDSHLKVTGSPRHDSVVLGHSTARENIRRQLGLPTDTKCIVFADSYVENLDTPDGVALMNTRNAVLSLSLKMGYRLLVKPHPLENKTIWKALSKKYPKALIVDKQLDIRELIKASDLFLSLGSTSAMDALIADKPSLLLVFKNWIWAKDYEESNAFAIVRNVEELQTIVTDFCDGSVSLKRTDAAEQFIRRLAHVPDGRASERIAQIIVEKMGLVK